MAKTLFETHRELRRVSKNSKSLILPIPPVIRDLMEFEHEDNLKIEVCLNEENKQYLRIYKED